MKKRTLLSIILAFVIINCCFLPFNGLGQVCFNNAVNYPVGDGPLSVTSADFNSDGNIDLAIANTNDQNVSIRLGNGSGTFGIASTFSVSGYLQSIISADFNKDGNVDIATANASGGGVNNISILLGNGSGSFSASTNFSVNGFLISLTSADFNGDTNLDLIFANESQSKVAILLGNGIGGFSTPTQFATGDNPNSVISVDFNNDGKIDIATANKLSNNVSVFLGNGDGSFGTINNYSVGSYPCSVTSEDFNGDGNLDMAVANYSSNSISVLLGNGLGSFATANEFSVGAGPFALISGDFNNDDTLDLATSNVGSNNVSVLLGNGSGAFGTKTNFTVGSAPYSLTKGDFNNDSRIDIATGNRSSNNVSILLNQQLPILSINTSNTTVCAGNSLTISASGATTYNWSGGITNGVAFAPTTTATYTVTGTTSGCSTTATQTITVNPAPIMNNSTTATICSGSAVNIPLISTVPSTYTWLATDNTNITGESTSAQTTSTLNNTLVNTSTSVQTVTYTITPTSTTGSCVGTPQTVTVTINPAPVMSSSNTKTICSGETVNVLFTSPVPSTYTWIATDNSNTTGESTTNQTGNTLNNTLINDTTTAQITTYTVTPTSTTGSCVGTPQTLTITTNPAPIMNSGNTTTICSGGSINISLTSNFPSTYTWVATDNLNTNGESTTIQNSDSINNTITNNTSLPQSVYYTITPTSITGNCIGLSQTHIATVNPKPIMNSSSTTTVCSGNDAIIALSSNIPSTYNWSAIDNNNVEGESTSIQTSDTLNNQLKNNTTITQSVIYTIIPVSNDGNCSGSNQIVTIDINPSPTITNINEFVICSGNDINIEITSTLPSTYTWFTETNSNITGYNAGIQTTDSINETLINISNNPTTLNHIITPTSVSYGCEGPTDTIKVLSNPLPQANAGNNISICSGVLDSIGNAFETNNLYLWNPSIGLNDSALSSPIITMTNESNTPLTVTYSLTVTNTTTNCNAQDTTTVTINPQPILIVSSPIYACLYDTINLTDTSITSGSINGNTLSYWKDINTLDSLTTPTSVYTNDTNYIKLTAIGGCVDIKPIVSIINSLPTVSFSGLNMSYCYNASEQTLIGMPSGGTFSGHGIVGDTFTAMVSGPGIDTIMYTYTDTNGCINKETQYTQILSLPTPPEICLVTVDSLSNYNVIIWDKTTYTNIDSFIVYRETANNVYNKIGTVEVDSLSIFIDTVRQLYFPNTGNPNIGTYKYKLQTVDTCGNYSELGRYHKTIYVNQTEGTFTFNDYEIENEPSPVTQLSSYLLLRDDNSDGNWQTLSSNTSSPMTDPNYESFPTAQWRVETDWSINCNPTRAIITTRSNIKSTIINDIQIASKNVEEISIYPNPYVNNTTITYKLIKPSTISIEVYNNIGQKVETVINEQQSTGRYSYKFSATEKGFNSGMYIVKINVDGVIITKRIVETQ
jgi:hypothetical protein